MEALEYNTPKGVNGGEILKFVKTANFSAEKNIFGVDVINSSSLDVISVSKH